MKKSRILYVTRDDDNMDDGLSYVQYLSQTMNKGVSILVLTQKRFQTGFENAFAAVAFAEANEHETARALMSSDDSETPHSETRGPLSRFQKECEESGLDVTVHSTPMKGLPAVREFLKNQSNIELVLMSPTINRDRSVTRRALQSLVDLAARPISVMSKKKVTA